MKKALSLILALALFLSLCACGSKNENITSGDNSNNPTTQTDNNTTQSDNNTPQSAYVGEWKAKNEATDPPAIYVLQLNGDGTGTYNENEITWEYSAEQNTIKFTILKINTPSAFQIQTTDGQTTLLWYGDTYYRAADFEESNG